MFKSLYIKIFNFRLRFLFNIHKSILIDNYFSIDLQKLDQDYYWNTAKLLFYKTWK